MIHAINEFDLFYISYDEPQKEEFWAQLQNLAPWAKRIDGVKGFDSAHKACANQSETQHFITVDGDNTVYPEFFSLEINLPSALKIKGVDVPIEEVTLSWAGRNIINGLCYGNGGLKLWSKDFVLNMRTHENAEKDNEKVDFCWDSKYIQLNNVYSDTWPNGSPFQAFRAGFREGVKMTLDRGAKASGIIHRHVHSKNFKRLLIWATIGDDVENGLWAIYGTRLGIYMANIEAQFDIALISDYDWFKTYFHDEILPRFEVAGKWNRDKLIAENGALLMPLQKQLGLKLADMTPEQSAFFKEVYESPKRTHNPLATEIEMDE